MWQEAGHLRVGPGAQVPVEEGLGALQQLPQLRRVGDVALWIR